MNDSQYTAVIDAILGLREATELGLWRVDHRFEESDERWSRRFTALETRVEEGFRNVDARFDDVYARFDKFDARFDDVYARFDKFDARFDDVYARFDKFDARVDDVYARFDKLDAQFSEVRTVLTHAGLR